MFDDLDRRLSDVSNAATRIGVQLETMDRVRLRARDVHDVIIAFNAANSGDVGALEALRPLGPDSDRQVRVAASQSVDSSPTAFSLKIV